MPRKCVNVTFVGATDVVEHVVSSTQTRRRTLASASDVRVDGDVVFIEEDCLQQKMSEELLDDHPSPVKSFKKSIKCNSLIKKADGNQLISDELKRPRRSCATPSKLTLGKNKTPLKAVTPQHTSSKTNTPSKTDLSTTNTPRHISNKNTTSHHISKSGKKTLNRSKGSFWR